jgi:hypothetical protein
MLATKVSVATSTVAMFRERPELVASMLSDVLGVKVPTYTTAQLSSSDLTDVTPTEYRADAVITLSDDSGPTLAVVEARRTPEIAVLSAIPRRPWHRGAQGRARADHLLH